MTFLIEKLRQTGPIDYVLLDRSVLLTMKKRDGGTYQCYEYQFRISSTGEEVTEKIFPKTHDFVLSKAKIGQLVRAEADGQYVKWTVIPAGEEALQHAQPRTNGAQIQAEKQMSGLNQEQREKDIRISLQGFAQAYVSACSHSYLDDASHEILIQEALSFAEKAYKALQAKARDLSQSHS